MTDVLSDQKNKGGTVVNQVEEDPEDKVACSICMDIPQDQGLLECVSRYFQSFFVPFTEVSRRDHFIVSFD